MLARAHPRVCGENPAAHAFAFWGSGSSPRVRGKREGPRGQLGEDRLIPACAGKTTPPSWSCSTRRAHPRVCGENRGPQLAQPVGAGSSPRVRGKLPHVLGRRLVAGLIPACAGKTSPSTGTCRRRRAHPRVCGENIEPKTMPNPALGSSPRVRGKPPGDLVLGQAGRLIPACAGKTPSPFPRGRPDAAHPRVCGENGAPVPYQVRHGGSSPRVRGKPPPPGLRTS